jgi:thiol-disulfide isomerase/thioredoxin
MRGSLAQAFEPSPIYQLPDVTLIGPNGEQDVFDLIKGRTILMPLWAEWCTPCLSEIPDFARLQTKYGNASFAIVPVLTGARKKVTPDALTKIFGFLHASVFEPLIESKFGNRLMMVMAATHYSTEIPCNLLIAPNGRVIAREIGIKQSDDEAATAEQDLADKVDPVARAEVAELSPRCAAPTDCIWQGRSELAATAEPVLIWPQLPWRPARSAMVVSSVSPERCDITTR